MPFRVKDQSMAQALETAGFSSATTAVRAFYDTRSGAKPPPEAEATAKLIEQHGIMYLTHGWRKRAWTPNIPNSPMRVRSGWGRGYEWDRELQAGHWWDHAYRLVQKTTGRVWFIGEPYHLEREGLRSLSLLAMQGWDIRVSPDFALHYPGRTLVVRLERRAASALTSPA